MLNQVIPPYEGNQPFLYACYCAEDEALAFPILARMYNEGFRLFSALACRSDRHSKKGDNDFRSVQRLNASSSVILFMSHNMLDRIRRSDPEVITAVKSASLRVVVQLDGSEPSGDIYALSVPDHIEYSHGNDAPFWLYIYSSDALEKCRGPWPEESKRLRLTESNFEDVSEEALSEEYFQLENILSGKPTAPSQKQETYINNGGYIMPVPDEYVYIPLDYTGDKQFDEVFGLLNKEAEQAHALASAPLKTELPPPAQPMEEPYPEPNWDAVPKHPITEDLPSPLPLQQDAPEIKADTIVDLSEPVEQAKPESEPAAQEPPPPVEAEEESTAEHETLTDTPAPEPEPQSEPQPIIAAKEPAVLPEPEPLPEPKSEPTKPSSVPVMVKTASRRRVRTSVTAVRRTKVAASHMTLEPDSAALIEANMRDRAYLQNYARRLVREAMAETVPLLKAEALSAVQPTEPEAPAETKRKHSRKPTAPVLPTAAEPVNTTIQPEPSAKASVTEPAAEDAVKGRKNKHPHSKGISDLFAALKAKRKEKDTTVENDSAVVSDPDIEDLLPEPKEDTPVLEAAVSKFMRKSAGK